MREREREGGGGRKREREGEEGEDKLAQEREGWRRMKGLLTDG